MTNCVFCKIINREIEAEIVYENDFVISFYGLTSETDAHVLVVPKKHITNILDITNEDSVYILEIHKAFNKVARILGIDESGFRIISNTGVHGQQEIMHLHYHLVGGRQLIWKM